MLFWLVFALCIILVSMILKRLIDGPPQRAYESLFEINLPKEPNQPFPYMRPFVLPEEDERDDYTLVMDFDARTAPNRAPA